jgi:hypothetical protein
MQKMISIPHQEKELVLKLLDSWYLDKIEKNYTEEVEKELTCWLHKEFQNDPEILSLLKNYGILSKQTQLQFASNYFSKIYNTPQILDVLCSSMDISPGVKSEYIDPMINRLREVKGFINEVFIFAHNKGYNNLTYQDIDLVFNNVFGGVEGFVNLWAAFLDAFLIVFDLAQSLENNYTQQENKVLKIIEALKPKLPFIIREIFG